MKSAVAVVDSAANIVANLTVLQAMSANGKLSSLSISGVTNSVTAAQAQALSALPYFSLSAGAKLNIAGTAVQLLADLGTAAFAKATSIEITAITPPGLATDNTVSAASAQTLASHAGFTLDASASLVVMDTAVNLLNTGYGTGIAKATAEVISGTANIVTANQAQTLAKRGATLAAGTTLQVSDVAANLLNAAYAGGLSLATQVVLGISAALTVAQAIHLMELKGFALASGVSLTIADTAANILNLNSAISDNANLNALFGTGAVHATAVTVTGYNVLSASQANTLAGISGLTLASGAKLVVSDTAQTLLSGSSVPAEHIATQVVLGTSATVSAAQAKVLGGLTAFGLASGVALTVADSAANLLFEQGSVGLAKATAVQVTGTNSLSAARATALAALPHVSLAAGATLVVSDSAANLLLAANYHGTHLATSIVVIGNNTVTYSQLQQLTALPQVSLAPGSHITVSDNAGTLANALNALNSVPLASLVTAITINAGQGTTPAMAITYTQYGNDQSALGKIIGTYSLTISGVPASAAASVQANSHVSGFSVIDTSTNVLNPSGGVVSANKLIAITLTDTTNGTAYISLTGAQYVADYAVLSRIITPIKLTVTDALAAEANLLDNDTRVTSFTVTDSSVQIANNLDTLATDAKLTAITITDGNPLALTATQYANDGAALALINGSYSVTVSDASVAQIAALQNDSRVQTIAISDSAYNVAADLDALDASGKIVSIIVNDGNPLVISGPEYSNDGSALALVQGSYSLIVNSAAASQAAALDLDSHVASFTVTDSVNQVAINLDALETGLDQGKLNAITFTTGTTSIELPSQFVYNPGWYGYDPNSDVDSKIVSDALTNIGIDPNTQYAPFSAGSGLYINLASISNDIQQALGTDPHAAVNFYWLGTELNISDYGVIQFENAYAAYQAGTGSADFYLDNYPPVAGAAMTITAEQYANDQNVLTLLGQTSQLLLTVTGVSAADNAAYAADSRVVAVTILDTAANVAASLDALNDNSAVTAITVSDGAALTITYQQSLVDVLTINKITGYSSLVINEPTLSGSSNPSTLDGTAGYQIVAAGSSGDTLLGGAFDTLVGGAGADTFVFNRNGATGIESETVIGFDVAQDTLQFTGGATFGGFNDFAHLIGATSQVGSDLVIRDDQGDTVTLKNVTLSAFASGLMSHAGG